MVRHTSIRFILFLTAAFDLELEQMDVKTAFLHGELSEVIYMQQPPGFITKETENKVCLLKRSLYGLKQSPRQWYLKFDSFIVSCGFNRSQLDHCDYYKHVSMHVSIYLLLYVDDMLIACSDKEEINKLKCQLSQTFEMKDFGQARRILGIDIVRNRRLGTLSLSQGSYSKRILDKFEMSSCKSVSVPVGQHFKLSANQSPKTDKEKSDMAYVPYSSAVGSLMYLMVCTRPDLAHGMSLVSRYMSSPCRPHWLVVKWMLRYLRGTVNAGLCYRKFSKESISLEGYVDADFAADNDRRRSLTGWVFKVVNNTVSWRSVLQSVVALSTTESEYMAASEAVKEALWLREMMNELYRNFDDQVVIHCDNQSAVFLSKNQTFHGRTKHIDVKFHFIRDVLSDGKVCLQKIPTEENAADMFTKVLPVRKFEGCLKALGFVKE